MSEAKVELFYSLSDPESADVLHRVKRMSRQYGVGVRETIATIHWIRARRRGIKVIPTLQVGGKTVWIGTVPEEMLERIFKEISVHGLVPAGSEVREGDGSD